MAYPNLIDPNLIIGGGIERGIPDFEKSNIFVELKTVRRGATVLSKTGKGSGSIENVFDEVVISMLGYDQETGKYTTDYTKMYDRKIVQYEGFGISRIEVNIDTSYVPKVNIEFTDVKGLSLFN